MGIKSIEDAKILKKYVEVFGREGVYERIVELAKDIVDEASLGQKTMVIKTAGMIRALAVGCNEDCYFGEKQGIGFQQMVEECKYAVENVKTLTVNEEKE